MVVIAGLAACVQAADPPGRPRAAPESPLRSHLQTAGELAAAGPAAAGLGLRLTRASAVLRRQLTLERGAGLVVDEVVAESAAERAGFRQHDVLVLLDDQLLVLPEQFAALVDATGTNAAACTVLRGGRRIVVALPAGAPAAAAVAGDSAPASAAPPSAAAIAPAAAPARRSGAGLRPTASSLALVQPAAPGDGVQRASFALETLVRDDPDCRIRVERGDRTRLLVTDPRGRVLFDGPIDTPAERSRMPLVVRDRVEAMEDRLEATPPARESAPTVEVGRLEVQPIELR